MVKGKVNDDMISEAVRASRKPQKVHCYEPKWYGGGESA